MTDRLADLMTDRVADHPGVTRSLGVERPGELRIFTADRQPVAERQFRVHTLYSGVSTGTELTYVKGTNPYLHARWDDELCVFDGTGASSAYPVRKLGYMEVGQVVESGTATVREGDLVAMAYGHRSEHVADALADFFVPVPADIDPLLGIYLAQMGPICANGLLHAAADLVGRDVRTLGDGVRGRTVLVTGGGIVGLLTGLLARHHGAAAVALADPTPARREAGRALGLEPVPVPLEDTWRWCKQRWHHGRRDHGADIVFQCRGDTAHLQAALRSLRPQGVVVDLAFYQTGAPEVRLGEEFHHNGLTVRCAQIARVPRGLAPAWDRRRLAAETLDLLRAAGPLLRAHMVTHVVPFESAPEFIADLAARRRHAIQAVLEFPAMHSGTGTART